MRKASYYSPDNLDKVVPYLPAEPKWLVLGGVADAREGQRARELWPGVRLIGFEPNPEAIAWQTCRGGWPADAPLIGAALGEADRTGEMVYEAGQIRNASLDPDALAGNRTNTAAAYRNVLVMTLDHADRVYGPFDDCLLWLDIEGSELLALRGASKLLARRAPLALNLELLDRVPGLVAGVAELMDRHGYRAVRDWNVSAKCRDRIYVREG